MCRLRAIWVCTNLPEQLEIAQLKREVTKLKAERDILKKPRPTWRRNRHEVRLHREAPGDLTGGMVVLVRKILDTTACGSVQNLSHFGLS